MNACEGLLGDLHLDVLAPDQRLAGQAGVGADVEGLVQPVHLVVLLLGERLEPLLTQTWQVEQAQTPPQAWPTWRAALLGGVEDAWSPAGTSTVTSSSGLGTKWILACTGVSVLLQTASTRRPSSRVRSPGS